MPGGRPTKYKAAFAKQAQKACEFGATLEDIAEILDVGMTTIKRWAAEHEAFRTAIKVGRAPADDRVEMSLYRKAMGYSFASEKVFMPAGADEPVRVPVVEHVPPSDTAIIFWLCNRRPGQWKRNREDTGGVTDDERARVAAQTAAAVFGKLAGLAERAAEDSVSKGDDGDGA